MSILISHSSVAPFVQQAARAIHEAGLLDRFVTTVRYDPSSSSQRALCRLARLARFDLEGQLKRRTVTEIPADRVESHPWGEMIRLLSGRLDRSGRLTDAVWSWAEPSFDRLVSRRVRSGHTAVYGFEYCSLATFERARELGVAAIYDVPAPEPRFVQSILEAEVAQFPELLTPYHRYTNAREERRIGRRRAEWGAATGVIAASGFTRRSFEQAGLPVDRVRVVPYGAPPPASFHDALAGGSRDSGPIRFLWAGTFGVRKGAHYLIEAWRKGGFGSRARLRVFGSVALPDRILRPLPDGIEFGGAISREALMAEYRAADALLFPTLCDGFGMVATEAWSQGTPVITTDRAGAADLLRPGRNGVLVKAADAGAIAEAIENCLVRRREWRAMREAAYATAANWQWSDYRRTLVETLVELGATSSYVPAFPPS